MPERLAETTALAARLLSDQPPGLRGENPRPSAALPRGPMAPRRGQRQCLHSLPRRRIVGFGSGRPGVTRAAADELLRAVDAGDEDLIVEVRHYYSASRTNGGSEPEPKLLPRMSVT
jgi:hypothetical protein